MTDKPKETVIAEETEFEGTITSTCGISLSGKIKGDVCAPSLRVQPTGNVDGRVEVSDLTSEGEISGQIKADHVQLSGKVSDRTIIRAKTLEVKLAEQSKGVQVAFGECELQVGDVMAKNDGARTEGNQATADNQAKQQRQHEKVKQRL